MCGGNAVGAHDDAGGQTQSPEAWLAAWVSSPRVRIGVVLHVDLKTSVCHFRNGRNAVGDGRLAASASMRVLVQRVTSASVTVGGDVVGAINPDRQGLLALVGVTHTDDAAKAQRLAEKLWQLRILDDEKSASDVGAPIMVVSQFTLYANTAKGRRPTWNAAAPGPVAEPLVTAFAAALRTLGAQVETGVFGADMQVQLVNDGPVTVLLEL